MKEVAMLNVAQITRVKLPPLRVSLPTRASLAVGSSNTRPLWFDGRFLAARDLAREQNYFLKRQAKLGQAAGFGVLHGLLVDQGGTVSQPPSGETIVVHAGAGITPSGSLVMLATDLTIQISDIVDEENLDEEFGLSASPQQPSRTRTGLYVLALRAVEFTANPIAFYPASLSSPRVSHDGDVVEATAVTLVPYTNPVNNFDASLQQAAVAQQIFLNGDEGTVSGSLLPLAIVSIDRDEIQWIDTYLVRRQTGPQPSPTRLGLADPATQQAYLFQYQAQLQTIVAQRQKNGQKANFAATDYFFALPPSGPVALDAIDTTNFLQTFFPQQMQVQLNIIPVDELPAVINNSFSMSPLDLTQTATSYANFFVDVLIAVPRNGFAAQQSLLPAVTLNAALPQVLIPRSPLLLLRVPLTTTTPPPSSSAWATVTSGQTYGFYVLRRSEPIFVDFTTPLPVPPTSTTGAPGSTPAGTTTPAPTTTVT